jgi:hypothetical protein
MNYKRKLSENVWYEIRTAINVGEPLFRLSWAGRAWREWKMEN